MDDKPLTYPVTNQNHPAGFAHPEPPPLYTQNYQPAAAPGFYPHANPPYPPHPNHNQPHATVITQQPIQTTYVQAMNVGPDPSNIVCPSCRQHVITRMDYETTTKTHLMAALICIFACWPCAWLPYVMDSCKNANHYCPSCGAFIGTYKS